MNKKKLRKEKKPILSIVLPFFFFISLLPACNQAKHFISNSDYRHLVHNQYLKRVALAKGRNQELFGIMKQHLSLEEKEALEFLYAFMPLSDLANLNGQYFLEQVKTALAARDFFSWGKDIPEDIFRHFVLPYRVNNENPDNARQEFFKELKYRLKNLNMYQAALEVNHWCHEKVTYRSTDERTSAPLATVKTAFGRCGEESTFTVAALRAVSIPARQVYTPRWAHTDDNHAWVEVWVNGRWYYLGACEPEPELNMAWFTGPAKRAMMIHTTVFGQYYGPEEVLQKTDLYTKINLLPNYAPTSKLTVTVKDSQEKPVPAANVNFCIYNYAEFYPAATKITNDQGQAEIITGHGDMMVWANKDDEFAFEKINVANDNKLDLALRKPDFCQKELDLDIIPPVVRSVEQVAPAKLEENNRRLREEDAIRQSYEATFISQEKAEALAREKGLPPEVTWKLLQTSRGNWKEILTFLSALQPKEIKYGLGLLNSITEKDLRDTPAIIFLDHIRLAPSRPEGLDDELYIRYVLSPRIGRELLTSWRSYIQHAFSEKQKTIFRHDPLQIVNWIISNIKKDDSNYYNVPLFPTGVLQLGLADDYSMKILFVAIARTLGLPARINQANERPCYYQDGKWIEISLEKEAAIPTSSKKSIVRLVYQPVEGVAKPVYYTHFTLARWENGHFKTLDYENDPVLNSFPCQIQVDPGYYLLVSGNRQPDGSVLCRLKFFPVPAAATKDVSFTLRTQRKPPQVLGKYRPSVEVLDLKSGSNLSLLSLTENRSFILLLIDPDKEPTKHLMAEIQSFKEQFSDWPGIMLVIIAKDKMPAAFNPAIYPKLPASSRILYDTQNLILSEIKRHLELSQGDLPIVLAGNRQAEIILLSEGYKIGSGEQLVKYLAYLR